MSEANQAPITDESGSPGPDAGGLVIVQRGRFVESFQDQAPEVVAPVAVPVSPGPVRPDPKATIKPRRMDY